MDTQTLKDIRCFLLDMDGTITLGAKLLPGAPPFFATLRKRGTDYLIVTNNSSKHRQLYGEKLRRLGLDILDERIFTSGEATVRTLSQEKPGARVYLVGTPALEEEFSGHGFELVDENPDYAVLGYDTTLTYDKLVRLCNFVRAGIPYIATHPDINCPTETGFIPDIGAMMALVEASTGRQPDLIVGKPYAPMVEAVLQKTGLHAHDICMVGDRLYTDIALGAAGIRTVLVLSGETRREDIGTAPHSPDFVMDDLGALAAALEK